MCQSLFALFTLFLAISSCGAYFNDLNLRADIEHAPFLHGVGSADPLADSVLIWTRVSQMTIPQVRWSVWEKNNKNQSFELPLTSGHAIISEGSDYTTTVVINNLQPGISYHYQFQSPDGRRSVIGTTKTASTSSIEINAAILSCTSLWSGYFNMYRHLANDRNIDVVIHLGDIIYNEIDPDELYRVPYGLCEEWSWFKSSSLGGTADDNLDESVRDHLSSLRCSNMTEIERFRWMHNLYLLDPDYRAARASHPWIVALDNHDLVGYSADPTAGSRRAALEWVPQRVTIEENDEGELFINSLRSFRFGKGLVDIIMLDTHSFSGHTGLLGNYQHQWLNDALANATDVNWRIFGSGKTFMPFTLNKLSSAMVFPCLLVTILLAMLLLSCYCSDLHFHKQAHYEIIHTQRKEIVLVIEDEDEIKTEGDALNDSIQTEMNPRSYSHNKFSWATCMGIICLTFWIVLWVFGSLFLHRLVNPKSGGLSYLNAHEYTWEGQPECETRLFDQLDATGTDQNNFWATGDMHFSYAADVVRYDPGGKDLLNYSPAQSDLKRYGVEMIAGSGTRGNLDEKLGEFSSLLKPGSLLSAISDPIANYIVSTMNRHYRYFDGQQHGYGMVKITPLSIETDFYRFPILRKTDDFHVSRTIRIELGKNQWSQDDVLMNN